MTHIRDRLYLDVEAERLCQEHLWGVQHHTSGCWLGILTEELGEVARAGNEDNKEQMRKELVEVTAVALAWLEDIDAFMAPLPPAPGERGRPKPTSIRQAI